MSTEYTRFTDRRGKTIVVDAQGIVQRIDLMSPIGKVYISLDNAAADLLLEGLRMSYEHNGWDFPFQP